MPGDASSGMVRVPDGDVEIGSTTEEREVLARGAGCHPSWLGDELPAARRRVAAFWIDRSPVTNAQYLAFCREGGGRPPAWWGQASGYPDGYADHPVVGVRGQDARDFAAWAGRRLPTPEEWEAALQGAPFPMPASPPEPVDWRRPGTHAVESGAFGLAPSGLRDYAGQCLEWVDRVIPHHGTEFRLLKGNSWFHRDPLNYRRATAAYAVDHWGSELTGFRCALDGERSPRPLPAAWSSAAPVAPASTSSPTAITLAPGGTLRYVSVRAPSLGGEEIRIWAPEGIDWNGEPALTWKSSPDIEWTEQTSRRVAYTMRFPLFTLETRFVAREDSVELHLTAINGTDRPATFRPGSCVNPQRLARFYDCELQRTRVLDGHGLLAPLRRFSRREECVRWITGPAPGELGPSPRWSFLAVPSRDGQACLAAGKAGDGFEFEIEMNTFFTCLHTDSTVQVPPRGRASTRQVLYLVEGNAQEALRRFREDFRL